MPIIASKLPNATTRENRRHVSWSLQIRERVSKSGWTSWTKISYKLQRPTRDTCWTDSTDSCWLFIAIITEPLIHMVWLHNTVKGLSHISPCIYLVERWQEWCVVMLHIPGLNCVTYLLLTQPIYLMVTNEWRMCIQTCWITSLKNLTENFSPT